MALVALVEALALAVGTDSENFSLAAGGDEQVSIGIECHRPDVFALRIEKYGFHSIGRDFVNTPAGRRAYVQIVVRIEGNRLSGEFRGLKKRSGISGFINPQHLGVRSARSIQPAV